jgi:beta-lactam-binding protein with PASTA domain
MEEYWHIYQEVSGKSFGRKSTQITHVCGKNYSRVQQKLLTCAAKITHVRGKNYSRAQQKLLTYSAEKEK